MHLEEYFTLFMKRVSHLNIAKKFLNFSWGNFYTIKMSNKSMMHCISEKEEDSGFYFYALSVSIKNICFNNNKIILSISEKNRCNSSIRFS